MLGKKQKIFLFLNFIFIIIVLFLNYVNFFTDRINNKSELIKKAETSISINAWVCREKEERKKNLKLVLCYKDEKILLTTGLYPKYSYGEELQVEGRVRKAEKFNNFDYPSYLLRHNIQSLMYYPKINKIGYKNLSFFQKRYKSLLIFKQKIRDLINVALPEPTASLANAMLLGYKKSLSDNSKNVFSKTGLSHLVAISGAHLSIISSLILTFLLFLNFSKKRASYIIILFLLTYPVFSGLSASCIRAALMAFFIIIANLSNRLTNSINPLIFTASVMLMFNPMLIFCDVGFQLSFLAVLGIIYLFPILEEYKNYILKKCQIRKFKKIITILLSYLNISIAAQLFCLPIIIKNFQEVCYISFLANILVIWIFPIIFISLIIAIILSFIFPALLLIFFYPSYICLKYLYEVSKYLAGFEAMIYIDNIKFYQIIIYYLILYFFIRKSNKVIKRIKGYKKN